MFMPEGYVNILFQKGLVLDDIIKLLNIKKFNDMQQQKSEFFNVVGCNKEKVKIMPLYVLTDNNGKQYFI